MHLVEAVLFLMALVIISNVLSHYIVAVPVSLIQVALGLGAALFFHLTINLATDYGERHFSGVCNDAGRRLLNSFPDSAITTTSEFCVGSHP